MIVTAIKRDGNKTYFDRDIKFASTKSNYVVDELEIGTRYDVKQLKSGLYQHPSKANRV